MFRHDVEHIVDHTVDNDVGGIERLPIYFPIGREELTLPKVAEFTFASVSIVSRGISPVRPISL